MTTDPTREPLVRRHALAWGLVALGLVTIVAMAAHGSAWSDDGRGEVRSVPHALLLGATVVGFILAGVLVVLSLAHVGKRETEEQRRKRWISAIGFIVLLAVVSIFRGFVHPSGGADKAQSRPTAQTGVAASESNDDDGSNGAATWWPLLIVAFGSAAALAAATARRRVPIADEDEFDWTTVELLEASLDDLRREPDARRAVVAAYARMEHGLAALGFAREPSETPTEYRDRAVRLSAAGPLAAHPVAVQALGELTELAERARFSTLPIDGAMRERAIDALEHLRVELRPRAEAETAAQHAEPGRAG